MRDTATADLFYAPQRVPCIETPAARASDPRPSHLAAAEVTANGVRANQQRQVLAAVKLWPGKTSRELADLIHMERHAVARRLPELETAGHVRKGIERPCTSGHRVASTWWPIPAEQQALAA